jgi:methyl-accepting chemotaxis protein
MVEEQTAASHSLAQEAMALDDLLRQFNLGNDRAAPRAATATPASRPVASPANALKRSVARAFGGGGAGAAAVKEEWSEF